MRKFLIRASALVPIIALAYLTQRVSELHLRAWIIQSQDTDLEMYARWQVVSWFFIVLAIVALIWAWVANDKD
jgi:hypothetical protein